ncbi:MAG TPA: glycosyltransferase [Gemmatimonadaceae bacterium]|nr:glycosyltransferase [Gemmatimonadaceae bacterium]
MTSAELSVVVPAVNAIDRILETLGALETQRPEVALEVLLVNRLGEPVSATVRERFPLTRILDVPAATPIPRMRALAFDAATAPAVAVIEDHVIVPPGWARSLLRAQGESTPVVGGPVDNGATSTTVDWAAFLCEYSACMPPLPAGATSWLPGNNVVYPRGLLERYRDVVASGGWENRLHDALRRDGIPLTMRPDLVVSHRMHYTAGLYLSQRFLYSRSFAADRCQGATLARRIGLAMASLLLPPVLLARIVSQVLAKGRYVGQLVKSLPLLVMFVVAWAAGEVTGTLAGAGDSLSKVR